MGAPLVALATVAPFAVDAFGHRERRRLRAEYYGASRRRARELGRPLVVVGAPTGGVTGSYPCGDLCVDLDGCGACGQGPIDVRSIPAHDDSACVFVSCVLELVPDIETAIAELVRVAGSESRLWVVALQPWTFTSTLYPGTRWRIDSAPPVGPFRYRPAHDARPILPRSLP